MTPSFDDLMRRAAALTRGGDLHAATAAIQRALGAALPASVPGARAAEPGAAGAARGDVIEVEARVVPEPTDAPPAAPRATPGAAPKTAPETPSPASANEPADEPANEHVNGHANEHANERGSGSFIRGHHAEASRQLDYKLYIPPDAGARPLPLVVMLHGCTQDPDDFAAGTAMNEAARTQGFFVLYPAQSQRANPQRCWNWFKHNHQQRGRGEPALIAGMTRAVMARHAVDAQRVYVAGLSAGGAMAAIVGEAYPELFAAVGVHSGLAAGVAADLPSALAAMQGQGKAGRRDRASGVPTIVFHGDADATVAAVNGAQVVAASVGTAASVEREQRPAGAGRAHTRELHRAPDRSVVAEHWVVHGAPHAWSGGTAAGSYTDARGPDASAEMLRFFFEHPRAPAAGSV